MSPIYLINLDRSADRLAFMREQADRLGLSFTRIRGQDKNTDLPSWIYSQFSGAPLPPGKIGCYASHLIALRKFVETKHEALILLQDDVTLEEDFLVTSEAAIASAPPGWDLIQLATNFKNPCYRLRQLKGDRWLVRHSRLPVGAGALAFSRSGAEKFLEPRLRQRAFDLEIRYGWLSKLDIYGVYPAPAVQKENFRSEIGPAASVDPELRRRWRPGLASRLYGAFYVMAKLGTRGTLSCWRDGLTAKS